MSDLAGRLAAYEHRLEDRAAQLERRPITGADASWVGSLPGHPQPTDVHRRLVDLFDAVLSMGVRAEQGGHPMLRASLRTIRKLRPVALEELARVPEEEVKAFMSQLVQQLRDAIGEGVEDGTDAPTAGEGPGPGQDLAPGAGEGPAGGRDPDGQEHAG